MTSSPQNEKRIVGIGSVVVDSQMLLQNFPQEDHKETAVSMRQQTGGPVPTALVLLQRFGFRCHHIGPWGDDSYGAFIEADLQREAVTWSTGCRSADCATGVAHVWTAVGRGSRTIVAHPANWRHMQLTSNDRRHLEQCDALHLDGNGAELAVKAAKIVAAAGGIVCVDAGAPKAATKSLLPLASIFSFPERFATQFFGHDDVDRAAASILKQGPARVVCTRGSRGAIVYEGTHRTNVDAFPVHVMDSTGAGDVFCGALLAGVLEGRSLVDATTWAAAAAALKCSAAGNREALPDRQAVNRLQQQHGRQPIE